MQILDTDFLTMQKLWKIKAISIRIIIFLTMSDKENSLQDLRDLKQQSNF